MFSYDYNKKHINSLFEHEYFYTVFIREDINFPNFQTDKLKAYASQMDGNVIVRIASDDNDIAMSYIEEIKKEFLQKNNMTLISAT